ncbi:MAG: C69 family dipeptidase [Methylocystaceae bacterium]
MCDTMVALGNSTRDGRVLFAKNSDRHPNEPHILIQIPQQRHPAGSKVRCTYIEVEQAPTTYAVLLLKPSWIWGCEMGANEFGLNIGNEAVFTRESVADTGLTGMDMIRLALERCCCSEEALEYLIKLLGTYRQGGNCGYGRRFLYHNSFLIADPQSAWVLETAGEYWAAARVTDYKTISNRLTLNQDYDRSHPRLIEHALDKGWCQSRQDFSFARSYTDPLITRFSGAGDRQAESERCLSSKQGNLDVATLVGTLRNHHPQDQAASFAAASVRSVCMHGGGLVGDHTTGSYVASLGSDGCTYWVTGSSTPCISVFKPLWLDAAGAVPDYPDNNNSALEFWYRREELHRAAVQGRLPDLEGFLKQRDLLEQDWLKAAAGLSPRPETYEKRQSLMARAWQEEAQLINQTLGTIMNKGRPSGGLFYRSYWQRQNRNLVKEQQQPRIFT